MSQKLRGGGVESLTVDTGAEFSSLGLGFRVSQADFDHVGGVFHYTRGLGSIWFSAGQTVTNPIFVGPTSDHMGRFSL